MQKHELTTKSFTLFSVVCAEALTPALMYCCNEVLEASLWWASCLLRCYKSKTNQVNFALLHSCPETNEVSLAGLGQHGV